MYEDPSGEVVLLEHRITPTGQAARQIAEELPGSELAYLVERLDLDAADDFTLVEIVAAWRRLASWAAAGAAQVAAVLAERPAMNPRWPKEADVSQPNVAGDELAIRLGCSRRQGQALVAEGLAYQGSLAWTGTALARGEIDPVKARMLVKRLVDEPVMLALDVQDALLGEAARRTPSQFARDIEKTIMQLDPGGAQEEHVAALRDRRVDRPRVLPNGMAGMWALLPAVDAARMDGALEALARSARAAGDPRTLDQLRADLLVDLTAGNVEGSAARLALARLDQIEEAAARAGAGRDADADDDGAAREGAAGVSSSGSERRRAGWLAKLFGVVRGQESTPWLVRVGRGTELPRPGSRRTEIRVTVALTTLLGLDDKPGELAGYGPIPAGAARKLAHEGTWRRIVTDPLSGRVLDVGRTRYRPPKDIADHVCVRDARCAKPGCNAAAEVCDLDHTVDFHREHGLTGASNLGPLCHRDHKIKTGGGFRLRQVEPGVFEWITPSRHRYRVEPGADRAFQVLPRPDDDDEPPF